MKYIILIALIAVVHPFRGNCQENTALTIEIGRILEGLQTNFNGMYHPDSLTRNPWYGHTYPSPYNISAFDTSFMVKDSVTGSVSLFFGVILGYEDAVLLENEKVIAGLLKEKGFSLKLTEEYLEDDYYYDTLITRELKRDDLLATILTWIGDDVEIRLIFSKKEE